MAFKKGESGNPAGRKKGSANKVTANTRQVLERIVNDEIANAPALLESLEPRDRLNVLTKLLPYVVPRLQVQELIHNEAPPDDTDQKLDLSVLTVEELETMYSLVKVSGERVRERDGVH